MHIKEVYADNNGSFKNSIWEILNYPVKPDKEGRHDPVLLAHVEHALHGRRRYVKKGAWYPKFPRIETCSECPVCGYGMIAHFDPEYEKSVGNTIKPETFTYDEQGVKNFQEKTRKGLIKKWFGKSEETRYNETSIEKE